MHRSTRPRTGAALAALAACNRSGDEGAHCSEGGRRVVMIASSACVCSAREANIENGFMCPEYMPFRHDFEGAAASRRWWR